MKINFIIAILIFTLFNTNAFAKCEKIEYQELKDMDDIALIKAYCNNEKGLLEELKYNNDRLRIGLKQQPYQEEICFDMQKKFARIYKKRFGNYSGLSKCK